ncbi:hypothetical protein M408DRAFT_22656 [Serendipita vermifera MAFF 305830]|uniref:TPR-like protein n=1 Tax=Serendipita vermifera MAFF 305830 TaxID=933852 RepID=A0A0C3BE93_SERVB|nr:hypothetical protein M408DRAFT_22656 [Serendipita vermifera MAFF 305830]
MESEASSDSTFESRHIKLVLYGPKSQITIQRIRVHPTTTYQEVRNKLTLTIQSRVIVLHAEYSPRPYWVESNPERLIEPTCRTLYAVDTSNHSRYLIGVVRQKDLDYPVAIFDTLNGTPLNISQMIVTSLPELADKMRLVTYHGSEEDVQGNPYNYEFVRQNEASSFPTVFRIDIDELTWNFANFPEIRVPPLLHVLLVHCKDLVQRSYDLSAFSLQMIHVSGALLHLVISLAAEVHLALQDDHTDEDAFMVAEEVLQTSPLITDNLHKQLYSMQQILAYIQNGHGSQDEIRQEIIRVFCALCGEYPGAAFVRHSWKAFESLAIIDNEEATRSHDRPDTTLSIPFENPPDSFSSLEVGAKHLEARADVLHTHLNKLEEHDPKMFDTMRTLASIYSTLGKYSETEVLQTKIYDGLSKYLGEEHSESLSSMLSLASTYCMRCRYVEAEKHQFKVLKVLSKNLGEEHPDTLSVTAKLALTYSALHNPEIAKKLQHNVLRAMKKRLAVASLDIAPHNLTFAKRSYTKGQYFEAEMLQVEELENLKTSSTASNHDILPATFDLALTFSALGCHSKATALTDALLEYSTDTPGKVAFDPFESALDLASAYNARGNFSKAEELRVDVLDRLTNRNEKNAKQDPKTLIAMLNLASSYEARGEYHLAEKMQVNALDGLIETLGNAHPEALRAKLDLALTYYTLGRYGQAEQLQRAALDVLRENLGQHHPYTQRAVHNLSLTYAITGRYAIAQDYQSSALDGFKKQLGDAHVDTYTAMLDLATTYRMRSNYSGAFTLEENALNGLKQILHEPHHLCLSAMLRLALTYGAQGRHSKAENLQFDAMSDLKVILGESHPRTLVAMRDLASTYSALGRRRHSDAESLQEVALSGLTKHFGDHHPDSIITMLNLDLTRKALGFSSATRELQIRITKALEGAPELQHVGVLSAMGKLISSYKTREATKLGSTIKNIQIAMETTGAPYYTLASLFAVMEPADRGLDSDIEMSDGEDDGLNSDMDNY